MSSQVTLGGVAAYRQGLWRLLGPAVAGWAACAVLIHLPGIARWVALSCAALGIGACWGCARARGTLRTGGLGERISSAGPRLLVALAVLLVLSARIDSIEGGRDQPEDFLEAYGTREMRSVVVLAGFPEAAAGRDNTVRGWVRARIIGISTIAADGATRIEQRLRPAVSAMLWLPGTPDAAWRPGSTVTVTGKLERGPPESLAAYEVSVRANGHAGSPTQPTNALGVVADRLGGLAATLRASLNEAATRVSGAELVPGLAVGDTSLVGDELDALMLESNLTHLTAVSGSNCALVIAAAMAVASRLGATRRTRIIVATVALLGFVVVVGPDTSVQRAAVMASVMLISDFGGKTRAALPALGLAMLVLLVADPWQAIQPGFALSVVATAGILLWAAPTETRLRAILRLPRWIALPLAVACVAQFACAPLLLLLQPGLSIGGILANVLAAPAAPLGTGAGLVAMLALPVSESFGSLVLTCAVWPARWIEAAGTVAVALPGGRVFWPGGWPGALTLLTVYALFVAALMVRGSRGRLSLTAMRVCSGVAAGMLVAVTSVVPTVIRASAPTSWAVVACDVGQGDALLVRDPARPDEVMLVDTGDDRDQLEECLDRFGVRRITLLVLSHDHADHVGALGSVIDRVESALLPPESIDRPEGPTLADRFRAKGIPFDVGTAGKTGNLSAGGVNWALLGPPDRASFADANATSLVVRATVGGLTVLLLGDTGESEQAPLLGGQAPIAADVVKVAHHGSRNQATGFYEAVGARAALISVGEGNGYGHPNADLMTLLSSFGTMVLRTDELGTIALTLEGAALGVWASGFLGQ